MQLSKRLKAVKPSPTLTLNAKAKALAAKGAYVLSEAKGGTPEVIIIATGSEVPIALEAQEKLERSGTATRVVSMPCREWFERQSRRYRDEVLPPAVTCSRIPGWARARRVSTSRQ